MAEPATFEELVGRSAPATRTRPPTSSAGTSRPSAGSSASASAAAAGSTACSTRWTSASPSSAASSSAPPPGNTTLDTPAELLKLLTAMTRNKLAFQVRKQRAARSATATATPRSAWTGTGWSPRKPTPSRHVEARELLGELARRLTTEERELVELRTQGHDWNDIADRLAGSPEALRKKHARALDRVAKELGLEAA